MLANYPPAPIVPDDSLPFDLQIAEYEQMMEAEQAQADTTSQQFESLAGKAVYGWIACSERMPEHGVDVQIFCSDTKEQFVGFRCIGGNDFQYGHYEGVAIVCSPSHWQPLPEPPCK
ncbi:TPA: DUF551 domain-containing protein [Cronobacter sakazakii]|nr:DUF551 domain-containing protein [Cronobacter sakazakii]HDU8021028.1 DUF551 domain-containing protein [Cronobacter sakazakii]